jgi:hypothetical protein
VRDHLGRSLIFRSILQFWFTFQTNKVTSKTPTSQETCAADGTEAYGAQNVQVGSGVTGAWCGIAGVLPQLNGVW